MKRLAIAVFVAVVLAPALARADAASAKRADELFRQAMDAQEKGRYEDACSKLEESNRLERALGTEYNLAACYEVVKRTATARRMYLAVVELATKTGKTAVAKKARDRAASLERTVPRLTLRAAPSANGATITLDGRPIEPSALGSPMEVDPGRHAIVAKAEGRVSFETNVDVGDGQRTEVVIALDPAEKREPTTTMAPAPAPSTSSSDRESPPVLLYAGFASAGVGVVALGIAGLLTLSASSGKDESGCRDGRFCPDEASADRLRDAQSDGNLATVFAVGGGVLLATGAALVVLAPPRGRVAVSPQGMSIAVAGTF